MSALSGESDERIGKKKKKKNETVGIQSGGTLRSLGFDCSLLNWTHDRREANGKRV